ncbi:FtsH protease activity modulator HflK [Roseomonas sp. 18066]|uniref:FtsH protease activity modulator HflK n=1 Tax=Roseomonas sp. 18066 TaxID=2681412 RepID=UPI001357BE9E|nr:FtsH protease activity modulator HflK [Roseomonas sp. 18066]
MPWNSNGGSGQGGSPWGNPRPGGPWGQPPQGGGGGRGPGGGSGGPDLDEAMRRAQEMWRQFAPGGGSGRWIGLGLGALLLAWAASGIYRVQPDEQGVVMRFGAFHRTEPSGLRYRLPWPVESVTTPRVTRINRIDIGFRAANDTPLTRPVSARDVLEESLMLTGDENIIDIDFAVFWQIRDAGEYLFNTRNPDQTVKSAAESVMREVVGQTPIQPALTEARADIEQRVRTGVQFILDQYKSGIELTQVQLLKVDPPAEVIDTFRDVQRANADRERMRNEAEAHRNDIIPRARGEGQRMIQEAEGFKESQVARARGEAARFTSVLAAYQVAKDVTVRRLYLETMEEILRHNPKLVIDDRLQGVVPYLPLDGGRPSGAAPAARAPVPPQVLNPPTPRAQPQGGAR